MKYAVIVTWHSGETTGAVINADGPKAAWEKLFGLFDFRHIRSAQLAEILRKRGGKVKKKDYPGGVKLTATKARAVAMQEFGTAKGLTKEETAMPGYFKMKLGSLFIRIHPDTYDGTGCIVVSAELAFATGQTLKFLNPDTLQDDYNALERHCKRAQRDDLKDWVLTNGADYCCEEVKRIWERG